ncbi:MAG TPA: hypothetical protein PKE66_02275, partial [Pyrinomonadaceae bacterium]|nr:hypothetical protein [Pyrinomonadaceae bacterium]
DTARYVEMIERTGSAETFRETTNLASEFAFLGLRLNEGIELDKYENLFGTDLRPRMLALVRDGLVVISNNRLSLTRRGMLYSNEVFRSFV